MLYSAQTLLLLASSIVPFAKAQTSSNCNPLKGCKQDNVALGTTYTYDFTRNQAAAPNFDVAFDQRFTYAADGMHMSVKQKGDAPTLSSQFYIFWGKVEVVMKAGPGSGIISSLVFQSDDLDEIDLEFVGNQNTNVQTNIFSKGDQDDHSHGGNHVVADTTGTFHKYTTDWTDTAITWSIDGNVVRTLTRAELGDKYPQTPMQIKFGPWAAGDPSNAPGTIEWAGGEIDYSKAPFDMVVASMTIIDYSTGAKVYRYKDNTGSSGSIEIIKGDKSETAPATSSTAALQTSTLKSTSMVSSTSGSISPTSTSKTSQVSTSGTSSSTSSISSSSQPPKSTFVIVSKTSTTSTPATRTGSSTTFHTTYAPSSSSLPSATATNAPNNAGMIKLGWSLLIVAGTFVVMF